MAALKQSNFEEAEGCCQTEDRMTHERELPGRKALVTKGNIELSRMKHRNRNWTALVMYLKRRWNRANSLL
jgi:hypothetical protein